MSPIVEKIKSVKQGGTKIRTQEDARLAIILLSNDVSKLCDKLNRISAGVHDLSHKTRNLIEYGY